MPTLTAMKTGGILVVTIAVVIIAAGVLTMPFKPGIRLPIKLRQTRFNNRFYILANCFQVTVNNAKVTVNTASTGVDASTIVSHGNKATLGDLYPKHMRVEYIFKCF